MNVARVAALVVFASIAGAARAGAGPGASPPNVVLIVVDTLRADRLSQYGYPLDTSGALSLLTSRATRFEECYSPAVWTAPAVASLFSGLSPSRHDVDRVGASLSEDVETLAETLRNAGWHTAAFSWNPHVSRKARFDQGFAEFVGYRGAAKDAPDVRVMTREAARWIERDARPPFFLYLQPMNVHGPYAVPEDALSLLLGRPPVDGFTYFGPLMKQLLNKRRLERRDDVTDAFLSSLSEKYDTAVRHTAEELGRFLARLDAAGLFDDALVVLTADHGEELFDHGGFSHRYSLHREILRVPLFVKLPGQRTAVVVREPVGLTDVYATLLDALGVPAPGRPDGRSLVPFLTAGAAVPETLRDRGFVALATSPKRCVGRAFRRGSHVLVEIERSYDVDRPRTEVYDLASDPDEERDLARSDPELRAALRLALERHLDAAGRPGFPAGTWELSDADAEALEALGYVDGR